MNLTRSRSLTFVCLIGIACALGSEGCRRKKPPLVPKTEEVTTATTLPRKDSPGLVVHAAWYEVPLLSLAYRRAGPGEFTAAHNKLPIGTHVRVTHLGNGKSVIVRVTDRGITDRRIKIDLCKGAAEKLDMISEGIARVRLEVLAEERPGAVAAQN